MNAFVLEQHCRPQHTAISHACQPLGLGNRMKGAAAGKCHDQHRTCGAHSGQKVDILTEPDKLTESTSSSQQDPKLRGRLNNVMTSIARAVRIGRGQKADPSAAVRPELFQQDEERALYDAQRQAASKVGSQSSWLTVGR